MRARFVALTKSISTLFSGGSSGRKYATKSLYCDAHMNELPVPCGPWHIYNKDKQSYYSSVLAAGAIWWLLSFSIMIYTESIYLNFRPPEMPSPPSDVFRHECEDIEF